MSDPTNQPTGAHAGGQLPQEPAPTGQGAQQQVPYGQQPQGWPQQPVPGAPLPPGQRAPMAPGMPLAYAGPAPGASPAQPRKGSKKKFASIGAAVLTALAVVGGRLVASDLMIRHEAEMRTGDCYYVTKGADDKAQDTKTKTDCSDSTHPTFQVVSKVDDVNSCPQYYLGYSVTSADNKDKVYGNYCLMPVYTGGRCYYSPTSQQPGQPIGDVPVDCTDSRAQAMVSEVLRNVADTSKCANKVGIAMALDPKTTYCLAKAQA